MVYKKGPPYRVRPVADIKADIDEACAEWGAGVRSIFFPAGNTAAMATPDLADICAYARLRFPNCCRITVYGSSKYLDLKSPAELRILAQAGLTRIHVGLESGDDEVLAKTKKGADAATQVRACRAALEAGLEVSVYVVLGLGGRERTGEHARATLEVLNRIRPSFVRLRTLLPKIDTPLLHQIQGGFFVMLSPHEVLTEARTIIQGLDCETEVVSDHYTNYINLTGRLPEDRDRLLGRLDLALSRDENEFRPVYVGTQ
jgi:radical SAM superfamily enzyme YgiQ (UPF0313 family)